MIQVDKKVYRNIEEQVAKNTSDIAKYADIEEKVTALKEECIDERNECIKQKGICETIKDDTTSLKNDCIAEKESCQDIEDNCNDVLTECQSLVDNWKYYLHKVSFNSNNIESLKVVLTIISNESRPINTAEMIKNNLNKVVKGDFQDNSGQDRYVYSIYRLTHFEGSTLFDVDRLDSNCKRITTSIFAQVISDTITPLFEEPIVEEREEDTPNQGI